MNIYHRIVHAKNFVLRSISALFILFVTAAHAFPFLPAEIDMELGATLDFDGDIASDPSGWQLSPALWEDPPGSFPFTISQDGNITGKPQFGGSYVMDITTPQGTVKRFKVLVLAPTSDFSSRLEAPALTFRRVGGSTWRAAADPAEEGVFAQAAGHAANGTDQYLHSEVQTTVNGPDTLVFRWKLSRADTSGDLELYLDGQLVTALAPADQWSEYSLPVSAGNHRVGWRFRKLFTKATSTAHLDRVGLISSPVITGIDSEIVQFAGSPIAHRLEVTAGIAVFSAEGLPSGLTLTPDGRLNGSISAPGTFPVTIRAVTAAAEATKPVIIRIAGQDGFAAAVDSPLAWQVRGTAPPTAFELNYEAGNRLAGPSSLLLGKGVTTPAQITAIADGPCAVTVWTRRRTPTSSNFGFFGTQDGKALPSINLADSGDAWSQHCVEAKEPGPVILTISGIEAFVDQVRISTGPEPFIRVPAAFVGLESGGQSTWKVLEIAGAGNVFYSGLPPELSISQSGQVSGTAPDSGGPWIVDCMAENQHGTTRAKLTLSNVPAIRSALDCPDRIWVTVDGRIRNPSHQTVSGAASLDSSDALRLSSAYPRLVTELTGPGTATWWFRGKYLSSSGSATTFQATLDGIPCGTPGAGSWSDTGWRCFTIPVSAGSHRLEIIPNAIPNSGETYLDAFSVSTDPAEGITAPRLFQVEVGKPFSMPLCDSAGHGPFTAKGLPPGLFIHPLTGVISGLPESSGLFTAQQTAMNRTGTWGVVVTTSDLPPAVLAVRVAAPASASVEQPPERVWRHGSTHGASLWRPVGPSETQFLRLTQFSPHWFIPTPVPDRSDMLISSDLEGFGVTTITPDLTGTGAGITMPLNYGQPTPRHYQPQSWIESDFEGPGDLSFRWLFRLPNYPSLSAEEKSVAKLHGMNLEIDGVKAAETGFNDTPDFTGSWARVTRNLGAGTHRVRWTHFYQHLPSGNFQSMTALDDLLFLPPATGWNDWLTAKGLPPSSSPADDSDGDTVPLVLEFALGADPARSDGLPLPVLSKDSTDRPLITIPRPEYIPGAVYSVEESTRLQAWSGLGVVKEFEDAQRIVFRGSLTGNCFLRIRVTLP